MTGKAMGHEIGPKRGQSKVAEIARLNDHLRRTFDGGRVVITAGIAALAPLHLNLVLAGVRTFNAFTVDNDPCSEHDCATLVVRGVGVLWKIDYYDPTMTYLSSDAADPSVTVRVLTIMLADEY
ncbi:acetylornithine/succinyldiaminopimelate/putrescine aminotransferase [Azospirillum agricola]|uniref:DUF3768 domain-containing protein n=1 Tax=Azospirillum agricola TaxID=1720247 RepID=UPI001F3754BD|nr:DUF3768 domain-containing protein [Azospirillum agricola]MBP2231735.1 acetylornithine/succinyldiaminopimelate/putrescine aminotransferase [Azospirillum agricola]